MPPTNCTCEPTGRPWRWTTLVCDSHDQFAPSMDGATGFESAGYGWFTEDEIAELPLHPGFAESWRELLHSSKNTTIGKCDMRRVDLSGQVFMEHPEPCPCNAAGGGGPEMMPHDSDGRQFGVADHSRASMTPGHQDDGGLTTRHPGYPEAGDDGCWPEYARISSTAYYGDANRPLQNWQGGYWPQGGHGTGQAGMMQPGGPTGIGKTDAEVWFGSMILGKKDSGDAVRAQMRENFPPDVLKWMDGVPWEGPSDYPLRMIDYADMKQWSAYKEPDRVKHFERLIKKGEEFNPVVMVAVEGKRRLRVVDGHHRALAYRNLGLPVHGYVGHITPDLRQAAEETHSSQQHSGASPQNA